MVIYTQTHTCMDSFPLWLLTESFAMFFQPIIGRKDISDSEYRTRNRNFYKTIALICITFKDNSIAFYYRNEQYIIAYGLIN